MFLVAKADIVEWHQNQTPAVDRLLQLQPTILNAAIVLIYFTLYIQGGPKKFMM